MHVIEKYVTRAKELSQEVQFGYEGEGEVGAIDWAAIIKMIFSLFSGCLLMTPRRMEREARNPPDRFLVRLRQIGEEHNIAEADMDMFVAVVKDVGKTLTEKDAKVGMKEASTT